MLDLLAHTEALAPAGFIARSVENPTDEAVDAVSGWLSDETVQEWLIKVPLGVLLILVVATLANWGLRRLIDNLCERNIAKGAKKPRLLPREKAKAAAEETRPSAKVERTREKRRVSRVRTLSQVGKSAVSIVVWVWAALAVLDKLGVNVAPLIASAGVVGVALGFGAQSVVKDFLSGIFMLLEDQYGVGDTIDVGDDIIGDVEDISLRLTTVRDIDGTLWYVRNGEIMRVGNFSDEFSITRLQIPVGLSNDPNQAWEVIDRAMQEACELPDVKPNVLSAPELQGVSQFEPDYISFRVTVTTMPGAQWDVQRRVQAHILSVMHDEGVEVPYPHGIGISGYARDEDR